MYTNKLINSFGFGVYYPPIFKDIMEKLYLSVNKETMEKLKLQEKNTSTTYFIDSYENRADFYFRIPKKIEYPLNLELNDKIGNGYVVDKNTKIKSKFYIIHKSGIIGKIYFNGMFNYKEILKNNNFEIVFTEINKKLK